MLNYQNRTIEPILGAISLEIERKFLTKTARTQGHAIRFFNEPFRFVPLAQMAEIADKFTRNEIVTTNEFRQMLNMAPIDDPKADTLGNPNMPDKSGSGEVNGEQKLNFKVEFSETSGEKRPAEFKAKDETEVRAMLTELGFSEEDIISVTQI